MLHRLARLVATATPLVLLLAPSAHASSREDRVERAVVRAVSRQRSALHLPRLHVAGRLARVADGHSRAMAHAGVLDHGAFATRLGRVEPGRPIGEAIAFIGGTSRGLARRVVSAWMASPPHRAILLDGSLREIGVARRGGHGGWWFTADLAGAR